MIVVSDTSPLNYLILIGQVRHLHLLFRHVIIPTAVHTELLHPDTPAMVRQWVENLPEWVLVRGVSVSLEPLGLDRGETEAIALAEELTADRLLIDERDARRVAVERGFTVTGTLGILDAAAARNLVHLPTAFAALRQTTFRAPETLLQELLRQDAARQSAE